MQNLTEYEKQQLKTIRQLLAEVEVPNKAPKDTSEFIRSQALAPKEACEKVTQMYRDYHQSQESIHCQKEELEAKEREILERVDMAKHCPLKKISPYRVYKRETAAEIKAEFPSMSNEERAQIVRERWRSISDSLKVVYVTLARFEQEKDHQDKVQNFYKERIQTARDHAKLVVQAKLHDL